MVRFGNPGIGTVVDIVAGDGDVPFDFGDGELQNIQITVTSINAAEDWFFGEITMTHTHAALVIIPLLLLVVAA